MKKIFGLFAAATMIFAAASCQKEQLAAPGQGGDGLVTFTIELPEALQTKTVVGVDGIADGLVYYEVWSEGYGEKLIPYGNNTTPSVELKNNKATLELRLVSDQIYEFVFWAQHADCDIYSVAELTAVGIDYGAADNANLANRDAFCNTKTITVVGSKQERVELYRPFAQLNFGAEDTETDLGDVELGNTEITVDGLATKYNVVTKLTEGDEKITFKGNGLVADGTLDANGRTDYAYLSMNFLLPANANANGQDNVNVTANFTTQFGVVKHSINDVPLQTNYRTNILGNLYTSDVDVYIEVKPAFGGEDNLIVLGDGIVQNVDGAYDITTSYGLYYAIENLFAKGGDFYILNDINMKDVDYTPAVIPSGVVVNIYGEEHIITKAGSTAVLITNLTQPLIATVSKGSAVGFENIKLDTETAFVETNEGTVSFENCANAKDDNDNDDHNELIGTNNGSAGIVEQITTAEALTEALAEEGGFVKFADDITQNETQTNGYGVTGFVHEGQVIDGDSFELTVTGANGTWDSAIYTKGGTIKNLTVAGAMRGIFMGAAEADLYIDNVIFKNVVYTFNSDGGSKNYGVYISNSVLNGWTSFSNVHKEVVFTNCKFAEGSGYAYCRPYNKASFVNCDFAAGFVIEPLAEITFENCTFGGEALTVDNLTQLVTTNTEKAKVIAYADSYESFVEALALEVNNIILKGTITIEEEVELDLNGKTIIGATHKNDGPVINNKGTLILNNGTISSTAANGGSALVNSGTVTLNGVTLNGAPNANGGWPSYAFNNTGTATLNESKITSYHGSVSSYESEALVTLNNCEIDMAGIPGFTNHGIYTYSNGSVVVNGGTYMNKAKDQASTGGSVINGAVTVNSGTFAGRIENYSGTPVLNAGTYSVEPKAAFVAAGKSVVDNGNGTWTVQ